MSTKPDLMSAIVLAIEALPRIANALERIADGQLNLQHPAHVVTTTVDEIPVEVAPAEPVAETPKRKRRTKAEIEADNAAQAQAEQVTDVSLAESCPEAEDADEPDFDNADDNLDATDMGGSEYNTELVEMLATNLKEVSRDDVTTLMMKVLATKGRPFIVDLFAKYGVAKLSALADKDLVAFYQDLEANDQIPF